MAEVKFDKVYRIHAETVKAFLKALQTDDVKTAREILTEVRAVDPKAVPALLNIPCGNLETTYKYEGGRYGAGGYYFRDREYIEGSSKYLAAKDYDIKDYIDDLNNWGHPKHNQLLPVHLAAVRLNKEMLGLLLEFGDKLNDRYCNRHEKELGEKYHTEVAENAGVLTIAKYNLAHKPLREIEPLYIYMLANGLTIHRQDMFKLVINAVLFEFGSSSFSRNNGSTRISLEPPFEDARGNDYDERGRKLVAGVYATARSDYSDLAKRLPQLRVKKEPEPEKERVHPDFVYFCRVLKFAYELEKAQQGEAADYRDALGSFGFKLLNKVEGSWQKNAERLEQFSVGDARSTKDAVREFTVAVVAPELFRKAKRQIKAGKVDVAAALQKLQEKVAEVLIGERSMFTVLDLQRDWHHQLPKLEEAIRKPEFPRKGEWPQLTPDYKAANGLEISFIADATTLVDLSKPANLNNCLYTYGSICAMGQAHVAVVKRDGVVLSAFELKANYHDKKVGLIQHEGPSASSPQQDEVIAQKELEEKINKGEIKVDFRAIKAATSPVGEQNLAMLCGFNPYTRDAKRNQTKALDAYLNVRTGTRNDSVVRSSHPFVPGGRDKWNKIGATKFLKQTGLMGFIEELAKDMPLKPSSPATGRQ